MIRIVHEVDEEDDACRYRLVGHATPDAPQLGEALELQDLASAVGTDGARVGVSRVDEGAGEEGTVKAHKLAQEENLRKKEVSGRMEEGK
jgi:hypothetical protein